MPLPAPLAYLLLQLDTNVSPPRVVDVGVYNEALALPAVPGMVYVPACPPVRRATYEEAARDQRAHAESTPWLRAILRPESAP